MDLTSGQEGQTEGEVLTRTPIWPKGMIDPSHADGLTQWSLSPGKSIEAARLRQLGKGTLVAYVEEIEKRMPATYPAEPISFADMLSEKTILASGPRFSARIAFHEISAAVEDASPEVVSTSG